MEIGKQIKKYRTERKLSQDELADKVYVTRQTISNWENDRNYPDIRSLVLLGNVFGVSLDILVKGDLEEMKEQINAEDKKRFDRDSGIFAILLIASIVLPIPMAHFLGWYGMAAYLVLFGIALYYALRVEKQKKKFDIQTYKEIVAFTEGKRLDELKKNQEIGKRPYQKVLLALGAGLITLVIAVIMAMLLK